MRHRNLHNLHPLHIVLLYLYTHLRQITWFRERSIADCSKITTTYRKNTKISKSATTSLKVGNNTAIKIIVKQI